jgi:hypothetical protein
MEALSNRYRLFIWCCILVITSTFSCSQSEDAANFQGELFIKMLDSPASLQQLNVTIDRVSIRRAGSAEGWSYASTEPTGSINLLRLRNGISEKLVLNTVAVGKYDQIKIYFGACTAVDNGLENLMDLDPIAQNGRLLNYSFEIVEGKQTQLTFDFDVSRSVLKNGMVYVFKPIIRIQNTLLSGSILGSVVGKDTLLSAASTILTSTGLDSVSTLTDLATGSFRLADLPEAVYSITVVPSDSLYSDTTLTNFTVARQQETNVGVIHLRKK